MEPALRIRDAAPSDDKAWRVLWAGYLAFYEERLPDAVTAMTWRRLLDPASPIFARLAERDGRIVGFAHSVLHAGTWTITPTCYLEDLFVDPASRGGGVASALIQDLIDLGRARRWSRLYWHTRTNNETARRVYDRFVKADDFVRYQIELR